MMKTTCFGIFLAVVIFASAMAHGLLGWPAFQSPLETAEVDPNIIGALAIGWYFGSAAMLGFAMIVLCQAIRFHKCRQTDQATIWAIASIYVAFGSVAWFVRNFNSHFLLFIFTGILVGMFAILTSAQDVTKKS